MGIMKASTLLAVTVGLALVSEVELQNGPPMQSKDNKCTGEELRVCKSKGGGVFEAEPSERSSTCPKLLEALQCINGVMERCKDNPELMAQYMKLQNQTMMSTKLLKDFCQKSSSQPPVSSVFLILVTSVLSLWIRK